MCLIQREVGLLNFRRHLNARYRLMDRYAPSLARRTHRSVCSFGLLPEEGEVVASMDSPTFCGQFSDDGQRFISACQGCLAVRCSVSHPTFSLDYFIRLYDTSSSRTFSLLAEIEVDDVGWSILDTALSPDRRSVAYSTWSDCSTHSCH